MGCLNSEQLLAGLVMYESYCVCHGLQWNVSVKEVGFVFLLNFNIRMLDFFKQVLYPQQVSRLICALYGICIQQYLPDRVFKKQCYSISAAGIVGFHADVLVKLGISVETKVG